MTNQGIDYLLEIYFRLGNQKNGKCVFSSLSDEKKWETSIVTLNKPDQIWREEIGQIGKSYEFWIPYWHFLNPRFVIGPCEAWVKEESSDASEVYSMGIIDLKGNIHQTNLSWLLDLAVSDNGQYVIATGLEKDEVDTLTWGPYTTYLYKITYDGEINDDNVRLRDSPSTTGLVIQKVNKGQKCVVLEHSRMRETIDGVKECWYKISLPNNKTGWVFGRYLEYW